MYKPIITKRCSHCKKIKSVLEFYKHKNIKDGFQKQCKDCQSRYPKTENGKQAIRKAQKKHWKTPKGKVTRKRYKENHPHHVKARRKVDYAVEKGILPRPDSFGCSFCHKQATEYHHNLGYEFEHWLDVIPVCHKCQFI